ncbi:MAG: enoyl-CoA hydratase/isomerase family protein [Candidatus Eremiobacteraeota bacterium]|nr:enoyl-CoA hydratase/isomerase family protein [Candidatus Eremiobacteraeota bacterium]
MGDEVLRENPADGVLLLRLNRPKKLNALSNAVIRALGDALESAQRDGTRAVVIAGSERAFAAGADIGEFLAEGAELALFDRLWSCELPMIAAVRGIAFGGGLELAMSCDMLVVAEDARLGQPEIKLGVMPGAGGTQRLVHAVGKTVASEMVFLGLELNGSQALARGLANRCVPSERVEPVALELARAVAAGAPLAMRAAKRAIARAFEDPLRIGLDRERLAFYELLQTEDGREGISAFLERRTAAWKGR